MNSFWTGFIVGGLSLLALVYAGYRLKSKFFKRKDTQYFKFTIPVIAIIIAFIIIALNLEALIKPDPIGKKAILSYVLSNKAILYLLMYIGVLLLCAVVWIITTLPFSFNGLKKFSGFGLTAEFDQKVDAVVESRSIINEMAAIRENTLNIITSEQYYNETLADVINSEGNINTTMLFDAVLDTIVSVFRKSESKIKIKKHLELVTLSQEDTAKGNVKELQKEMSVACLDVIRHRKPYLWEKTLAIPVNPFDMEDELDAYYIICIHSEDVKFSDNDVDFLTSLIKVVEKFVELDWYKIDESESEESNTQDQNTGS
ncbi:hypothetical protein BIV60_11445 [Bacillus sp. MUM 116]|uniref:hypothetical protein n=1 Tax=Bacillus sp. MUM 116 TaxID=1678002 RepID=UPI0008F57179|nr:hypothetical protein [Bacillus sp. MUM 116]OIK14574.1 hypothetical protein BIV60_11445 [Bacillus sp. MUM 116]